MYHHNTVPTNNNDLISIKWHGFDYYFDTGFIVRKKKYVPEIILFLSISYYCLFEE